MNIVIIEDEDLAANHLKSKLLEQNVVPIQSIKRITSVSEMSGFFNDSSTDLVFLDIHLADGNSLETLSNIDVKIPIIFTTAYHDYAVDAFKHFAIDYLLKPFDIEALEKSLEKLISFKQSFQENINHFSERNKGAFQKRFLVNQGNELLSISVDDISFFYGFGKHLFIYTNNKKSYLYNDTIKNVITKLNPDDFIRINRNYIIGFNSDFKVIKHSSLKIEIVMTQENPNKEQVFVSKSEIKYFKEWLNK
ncbi:LytTR family DNA-binding domain-containing protein [Tenacibaculum sp. IB213877]|uniref:LytR/AlgR family response regulator transcription factor n=1 Tax=Tenacibaculum sp. IB213877 TaxID=3097351 RepID=UPI002A5A350F|nr:LytTR family DNA-binding domain-containing protein [Tenacibaculum sp. IB213877]MDY0781231.1 LytTR family DNA-binding domain-containing protein [Tenacibaculum sp. IB213877]